MMPIRQGGSPCWFVLLAIVIGVSGCRDDDPPPAHNRDLGDGDIVLLPTGSAWHDPGIAKGKADWHPFRVPGEESGPDETDADGTQSGNAETEAEIRDLIEGYNELAEDPTLEELLDYYVEQQRDALTPLLESMMALTDKLIELCEALETKLPDEKGRIDTACDTLGASHSVALTLESVTVISATEATGMIASQPQPMACRFVVIDDEWFIELQGLTPHAEAKPALDALLAGYATMVKALESGQTPPQQVLGGLEQAAGMVTASSGGATGGGTGDSPAAGTEPASTHDGASGEEP